MKYVLSILLLAITINCKSQVTSTVPLGSYDPDTHTRGMYYKDLNNELLPYVGNWEGVINNRKYTFTFVNFLQVLNRSDNTNYYYSDELLCKLKVIDLATNTVLYDDSSVNNYTDYKITGISKPFRGLFSFVFIDSLINCENRVQFTLKSIPGQLAQLKYCYFEYLDWEKDNCSYTKQVDIPLILPTQEFTLTKI